MPKTGPGRNRPLGELDQRIINRVQRGLPLVTRPFAPVAAELGLGEEELLEYLRGYRRRRLLSYIGPLYYAEAFGRGLSLASLSVPADQCEAVARRICEHPAVVHLSTAHNPFNIWFTVKAKGMAAKQQAIEEIERQTGQRIFHLFSRSEFHAEGVANLAREPSTAVLTELDWKLIAATEKGLLLEPAPYAAIAQEMGVSCDELLSRFQRLAEKDILLRNAAVPNYCRLGYRAAGLGLWEVNEAHLPELGRMIARLPWVSQCSLRPQYLPHWPFNLLVVVHGRNRLEVREHAREISSLLGADCRRQDLLFRGRTFKKTKAWPLQGIG